MKFFFFNLSLLLLLNACSSANVQRCPSGDEACGPVLAKNNLPPVEPLVRFRELLVRLQIYQKDGRTPKTKDELIVYYTSEGLRNVLLQIEGLCKIYEDGGLSKKDTKHLKDFHKEMKAFEDIMGQVSLRKTILKIAEELEKQNPGSVNPILIASLRERLVQVQDAHYGYLEQNGWLPDPKRKVADLVKYLEKIDFKKAEADQRQIAEDYLILAKHNRDKIKDLHPFIFKDHYTVDDLEAGMHEFRRTIRWMTLILHAARGVFAYSDKVDADPEFAELYNQFKDNKYFLLEEASIGHFSMDKFPFLRLSKLINDLGTLKDTKEAQLYLAEALYKSGVESNEADAAEKARKMALAYYKLADVEPEAQKIYTYYSKRDPLKDIIENLKRELKK